MTMHRDSRFALLLAVAACTSASDRASGGPRPTVRDSAGVTIVDNTTVDPATVPRWTVDTAPSLRIGTQEGDPAYELGSIGGVQRLPNGMIVVLNGQGESAFEFRFYDSTGKHIVTHGRRGQGPGEYRWINYFGSVGGDTLIGVDFPNARLIWVSASQGHLRSVRLNEDGFRKVLGEDAHGIIETMTPLGDSIYAVKAFRRIPGAASPFQRGESFHIVNLAAGTAFDLVRYDDPPSKSLELSTARITLRPAAVGRAAHVVDRARGRICALITHASEISCIDGTGKRSIIRWRDDSLPFTDDDRRADEEATRRNWERSRGTTSQDIEKLLAAREVPDRHKPVIAFQNDTHGNFWILEPALDSLGRRVTRFRVLDPEGRQIAFADPFPARSVGLGSKLHIGDQSVLRAYEDADGVPIVGEFRIRKPD